VIRDFLTRHGVLSILLVLWICWLVTKVIIDGYLPNVGKVNEWDAAIIGGGIIGIVALAIDFRKWSRDREK